jgi:hypothetical protein
VLPVSDVSVDVPVHSANSFHSVGSSNVYSADCVFNSVICSSVNSVSSVEDVSSDYSDEVYKNFNNTKNTTLVSESNIIENIDPILCDNSIDPILCDNSIDPILCDNSIDSILCDNSIDPILCDNSIDSILCDNSIDPILCDNSIDSIFWGISCEKLRFYPKKIIFFPILGGGGRTGCAPGSAPVYYYHII